MSSAIAYFTRLQETTSHCALTLCHAVFPVLRLPALLCPALRPPASQCAPGLNMQYTTIPHMFIKWTHILCSILQIIITPCLL